MSLKSFKIDKETLDILSQTRIEDKVLFLPDIQLERSVYDKVNKALVALGAKWNKKSKGHVFDYDISQELERVIQTGEVVDWKKSTDFFYTPKEVVLEMCGLLPYPTQATFTILEPSAGQGHILDVVKECFPNVQIKCIEQNPRHCERLAEKGYEPINNDFMNIEPFNVDVVLMNPPFTYEVEHIQHAFKFLNDGGTLISVASGGILTKSLKKNKEFKDWFFNNANGYEYKLREGSFKESGTNVNTMLLFAERVDE